MTKTKPLTGLRVLELGAYISGPYAGSLLAALGADVVKVEPPRGGDAFRRGVDIDSHYFVQYNAGKRSIALDLKKPEAIELVKSLLPKFDVFIENSRPGKMETLGLGPAACVAINPGLVYSSASGFGDGGPWRDRAAYDSMGQSMGGFYSIMNDTGVARLTGTCVADLITGLTATMGILIGLVGRGLDPERRGTLAQTSLVEAMSTLTIDAMTQMVETGAAPTRETRHPQAQNFCLLTSSGDSISLHLSSSEKFWQSLARAIGRADLIEEDRFRTYYDRMDNYFELRPIVEAAFLTKTRAEWEALLIAEDVPFAPVLSMMDIANDPQTDWLKMLEPARNGKVLVRPPWRFWGERPDRPNGAPHLGEHSREVALEVRGADEVDALIRAGVIVQAPPEKLTTTHAAEQSA